MGGEDQVPTQNVFQIHVKWYIRAWYACWRALGFRHPYIAHRFEIDETAAPYIYMSTKIHFDFRSRLRVLLTGYIECAYRMRPDVPVTTLHAESVSASPPPVWPGHRGGTV